MKEPKTLIQLAVDALDFDVSVELVAQVSPYIDIIEIGTPCIKHNGINLVHKLKEDHPDKLLLVDLKTMDAGEYEAMPFYEAGADICTVCGAAGIPTIAGVVVAANKHGKEAQVDMINVANKVKCASDSVNVGAHIIGIHTGLDAQARGMTPFRDLNEIVGLGLPVKISVAGGINLSTAESVMKAGVDIVVCGAAIYGAPSPVDSAREIYQCINS
jgi:3-hexulose-6-phosphate synthase